jgi:hypothetical protein
MDPESFSRATDPTFQFVPGLGTNSLKTWPNWQIWGVHNGIGARPFRHVLDFLRICVPKVCNLRRIGPFWGKILKKYTRAPYTFSYQTGQQIRIRYNYTRSELAKKSRIRLYPGSQHWYKWLFFDLVGLRIDIKNSRPYIWPGKMWGFS